MPRSGNADDQDFVGKSFEIVDWAGLADTLGFAIAKTSAARLLVFNLGSGRPDVSNGPRYGDLRGGSLSRSVTLGQEEFFRQRQPLLVGNVGGYVVDGHSTVLGQGSERYWHADAQASGCFVHPGAGEPAA